MKVTGMKIMSQKITKCALSVSLFITLALFAFQSPGQTDCSQLIWSDEFESQGNPSLSNWNFETGGGGWGNNELQFYTNSSNNSYVSNGTLKIHARKVNGTWTSARMVTSGKASWKYGRFEIRAKLPAGKGTWPAIWMMPQAPAYGGWPKSGEIDIMEHVGYEMNKVHGTIHTEAYNHSIGTQKGGSKTLTEVDKNFYLYAIEWNEQEIKWYVDGSLYFTFKNENKTYKEWPFDQPFFLILNIAIGGNWGGAQGIDPNLTEAIMEIDYVRVYSSVIATPVVSGPSFVSPGEQITFSTPKVGQLQYRWILPEGVTVISGNNTHSITVQWNDKPGDVLVEAFNECQTVRSAAHQTGIKATPSGKYWPVPLTDAQGNLIWTAFPGVDNQINLRKENDELVVTYAIQNTSVNPYIEVTLPVITDLSAHKMAEVQVKSPTGQGPSIIRIDLLDNNGQIDLEDLFRIDGPVSDGQFHTYQKLFAMNPLSGWQTSKIARIAVWFNYGVFRKAGNGEFRLKGAQMINSNYVSAGEVRKNSHIQLFPNPATEEVTITSVSTLASVEISDVAGRTLFQRRFGSDTRVSIPVGAFPTGVYLVKVISGEGRASYHTLVRR